METRVWTKSYDEGVPAAVDFEQVTLSQMLERTVERHAGLPAIVFMNRTLTYRELSDQVDRLATALANLGVQKDSRVAIQLPNLPQVIISYYAALKLGAQVVMTNPLYMPREIEHQWHDAHVDVAICADFIFESKVKGIRDKLPVKHYIIASIPEYLRFPLNLLAPLKLKKAKPPVYAKVAPGPGIYFFRKLIDNTPASPPKVDYDWDHLAVLQYTGGTTGVAKGAMLTHRNLSANVQQIRSWFPGLSEKEVFLAALPYFHVFGMTTCMNVPIFMGSSMVLMPNPRDIALMVKNVTKHKITMMPAVPAMFNAINNFPGVDNIDLTSVKSCFSGSAPLPVDVLERFERLTGSKIVEGFGMTESSPVTHINPLFGHRKVGSIGIPLPNTDARVVDIDDGKTELEVGKEGELILHGPQVMKGYWNMAEETSKVLKDDWLYTGDLATMDADGYFKIVGRKKDMIVAGGYNVYPDEIDSVLMMHDAVLEAATIGIPDPKRGENVKSFIVLKPGQNATEDQITAHCKDNLAAYKVPKLIEFRDDLPKSTVLKVLRRELRDQELAKLKKAS